MTKPLEWDDSIENHEAFQRKLAEIIADEKRAKIPRDKDCVMCNKDLHAHGRSIICNAHVPFAVRRIEAAKECFQ